MKPHQLVREWGCSVGDTLVGMWGRGRVMGVMPSHVLPTGSPGHAARQDAALLPAAPGDTNKGLEGTEP